MLGYYVLAFDGYLFETTLYPAVWRAYYLNDFTALQRLADDYPLLHRYYKYAQDWTRRGCRRPLKHFTSGICEYNTKSPGSSRLDLPDPADGAAWSSAISLLEQPGRCALIAVPCGQGRIIHHDLIDLCRYKTAAGVAWQLGTPAQREFIHAPLLDARYANFVDLVAGALTTTDDRPSDTLRLLGKLSHAFRPDLELNYTGDQTGFLGYLTAVDATHLHKALAPVALPDSLAQHYLACLHGFLADARDHHSGLLLEVLSTE